MFHSSRNIYLAFVLICTIFINTSFAQKDTSQLRVLNEQSLKLQEIQLNHITDSVRIHVLQEELNSVRAGDYFKKNQLQSRIQNIKKADKEIIDAQRIIIDSLKNIYDGYPVILYDDTIFTIYSKIGRFSPEERAESVTKKMKELYQDFFFSPDSLQIIHTAIGADIVYKDNIITSTNFIDAFWENTSPQQLAQKIKNKIIKEITAYKNKTSFSVLFGDALRGLLVITILIIIITSITKFFRWIKFKLLTYSHTKFNGIKIYNYTIFNTANQLRLTAFVLSIVKWFIIIIAVYLSFPVIFSFFPWTQKLAGNLISYILDPLESFLSSIWEYLPNLFTIIIILVIFYYLEKFLRFLKDEIASEKLSITGFYPEWANPTFQIVRIILIAFIFVISFPYLPGSSSPIFKGISVFLGVLFTFGSSGPLSNSISGIVLTYMRTFKLGDRVKIGDVVGDVVEKDALVVRLRTIKNEIVSIPNVTVMSSHTINYNIEAKDKGLILYTSVTIGYSTPWRKVHELLINAAKSTALILNDPEPFVLQTSLNDFFITYQINAYTNHPNQQHITYSILHQNIQDKFNEAGVEIMSPHYTSLRDGNNTSIPNQYHSENYSAPEFKIHVNKQSEE